LAAQTLPLSRASFASHGRNPALPRVQGLPAILESSIEGGFMRKLLLTLSSAGALVMAASASQAMPLSNAVDGLSSPPIVLTAGGCGIGFHRGPYGGCRPNGVWRGPYWRGPGWHYYNGCWRGPYGHIHCR